MYIKMVVLGVVLVVLVVAKGALKVPYGCPAARAGANHFWEKMARSRPRGRTHVRTPLGHLRTPLRHRKGHYGNTHGKYVCQI